MSDLKFSGMDPADPLVGTEDVVMVQYDDSEPPVPSNARGGLATILAWILGKANSFTNQQAVTPYRANISGAVSIDLAATAKSNKLILTCIGNVSSFALVNPVDGASYSVSILQDATGGRTMPNPLGSGFKFSGGTQPTWTTTANARDKLVLDYDATAAIFECAHVPNFS